MIEITTADKQHIPAIIKLSKHLWPIAFAHILSKQQIDYMMEMMYSCASLEKQMDEGHQYAIARIDNADVGYVSHEINCNQTNKTKIHKLYISPAHQRQGVGQALLEYVVKHALQSNNRALFLNVNKHNTKAINFYKKHHFFLTKKEEIDIGNGFIMDDYVFELTLDPTKL